ncbi:MAG: ubiquinone biosynthesis regulatory protein kinase UbiB [Thiotrichaceae bacterium]
MIRFIQIQRLFTINRILVKHGLDEILLHIPVFRPLRFFYYIAPWNIKKKEHTDPLGVRIRLALEDLGPVFIKFGQMLSTRNDLLPPDINKELSQLQDNVPAFPSHEAIDIIEKSFGEPIATSFKSFDEAPLASASIAQVHTATLWNGDEVIVKVVRPDIKPVIEQDIQVLFLIAKLANRYWKEARRLHPVEIVEEYESTILDELDLVREAANASQLHRNFENSKELYVPRIYWDMTHDQVLVMERIHGIPIGDMDELKRRNVNMKRLGELGVEIFFTQVFKHNFFHADMHPGNIFVDAKDPDNPFYITVDFGIVGTLTPDDQRYLAENLHAFFNRDYKRVAELHIESGWVPAHTRVNDFESAIRTVCEPIFNRPLKEISFGFFLLRLFQTARRFDMEVQPQLVLLQKTLLNIEGLGRQLYPDLDLWDTAKPFLQRWMDEQVGMRSLFNGAKDNLPKFIEQMPHMPTMVNDVIKQMHDQQRNPDNGYKHFKVLQEQSRQNTKRMLLGIAGGSLIISSALVHTLAQNMDNSVVGFSMMGGLFGLSGIILSVYAYFKA